MPGRARRARGTDPRAARRTAARAGGRVLRRLRGGDGGVARARRGGRVGSRGRNRRPPRQLGARRCTSRGVRRGGHGSSVGPIAAASSRGRKVDGDKAVRREQGMFFGLTPATTGTPKSFLAICWNRVIAKSR